MCQRLVFVLVIQRCPKAEKNETSEPIAIAARSKGRRHKTCVVGMEVVSSSIFARRLIDTVLRNNMWQFKNVRYGIEL